RGRAPYCGRARRAGRPRRRLDRQPHHGAVAQYHDPQALHPRAGNRRGGDDHEGDPNAVRGELSRFDAASGSATLRPVVRGLLQYGVVVSAFVTIVGLGLLLVQVGPKAFVAMPSIRAPESTDLTSLRAVLRELVPPQPEAVLDAGILLLIATPALTVGVAAI